MKVQLGVLEANLTVFDREDLHLREVIGLLELISVVLNLFVYSRDLELVYLVLPLPCSVRY
jgi:hypothetical protein